MNVFFKTFLSEPKNHITKQVSFPKMSSPLGWGSASVCSESPPGSADSWKKNWCLQTWIWGDSEVLINPDAPHRDELQEEAARFRQHTHTHTHIPGPHLCVCVGPVTGSINWQAVTAGHHTHTNTPERSSMSELSRDDSHLIVIYTLCVFVYVCVRDELSQGCRIVTLFINQLANKPWPAHTPVLKVGVAFTDQLLCSKYYGSEMNCCSLIQLFLLSHIYPHMLLQKIWMKVNLWFKHNDLDSSVTFPGWWRSLF